VFVLLKDAMFCAFAVLFMELEIFRASALVLFEFNLGVCGLSIDEWFLLAF
jgi:hypothetical protein